MSNKTKFTINGIKFQLADRHVRTTDWNGEKLENPTIRMSHSASASVIKQYVKNQYPEVTCAVSSSSYSGGCSVDVYLTDVYGNPAAQEIKDDVKAFGNQFVYGSFNGMIDMYEQREERDLLTPEGYTVDASLKYLFVNTRPKHASLQDVYQMLKNMLSVDCTYVFGQCDLKQATKHIESFGGSLKNIEKAILMMAEESENTKNIQAHLA